MASTPFDDLDESSVLTPKDIADRLRVDARSVRRAIARGELPASRTCGLRVLAVDAAAWWRGQRVSVVPRASRSRVVASSAPTAPPSPRRVTRFAAPPERLPLPPRAGRA